MDIRALSSAHSNLGSHIAALAGRKDTPQADIDNLATLVNDVDSDVVAVLQSPSTGPRTDIDFSKLDAAVLKFKSGSTLTQEDADNVAGLITRNTR